MNHELFRKTFTVWHSGLDKGSEKEECIGISTLFWEAGSRFFCLLRALRFVMKLWSPRRWQKQRLTSRQTRVWRARGKEEEGPGQESRVVRACLV